MEVQNFCVEYYPTSEPYECFRLQGWGEIRVYVLEEKITRIVFLPDGKLTLQRTWMVCSAQELPWDGRDRFDVSSFTCPAYHCVSHEAHTIIETSQLRLMILHRGFQIQWSARQGDQWIPIARDRATQSYNFGQWGKGFYHYLQREQSEQYFGLGEKCGNMDRAGRRFRMKNIDAMGYDAETTDPLYKHIPFYITRDRNKKIAFGLLYDNAAICEFDLGQELDNYHGLYRSYQAQEGDLDYYMILGPTIAEVVRQFTRLTGPTIFGPKWSLGYSGSTMKYTDAPNAQEQLQQFIAECQEHDIPCDSFQLSSGYTSIGTKRHVFNWNRDKIPEPQALTEYFHQHGVKLCANIKPCLLLDNPLFQEAQERSLLIRDRSSERPQIAQFWDDVGTYLDFTNPDAVEWWKHQVKDRLLAYGIDSTWNDNNEFEIWNENARCFGFGHNIPIALLRPIQALLMMKTSFEAQQEFSPEKRPYLISRSGCPGMQRYVQTWTGDNRTAWKTLRYNTRMGKGLSLSGIFNFGHDVGGFTGNAPEPELFVRWVQNGIFHPRFTIHSWNDDGTVNEPWMYPDALPIIRKYISFRYKLMPYLYTLLYRASMYTEPIIRPTFYEFEADEQTFEENDEFLLGASLLVASVMEKGQRERDVYLPAGPAGWYDFHSGAWHPSGQTLRVPAPLDTCPLFVKEGSIIPLMTSGTPTFLPAKGLELRCYPPAESGETVYELFEDDGETWNYANGQFTLLCVRMRATDQEITIRIEQQGEFPLPYQQINAWLPPDEHRRVTITQD